MLRSTALTPQLRMDTADKQFSHPLEGQVAIMCTHARAACEVWSAGGTNTVNLYGFLPVLRENVNTSRFSAKVKSFPEKLRFSFRQVLEYNLLH